MSSGGGTSKRKKYIPRPDGLNAHFYQRATSGTLHIQQCQECGRHRHPPRFYCPHCGSGSYDWSPSPGRGGLFSWTVTHRPYDLGWADELPYATGVVELDEGVRIVGAIEGLEFHELTIGRRVTAHLDQRSEEFVYISFRPDDETDTEATK